MHTHVPAGAPCLQLHTDLIQPWISADAEGLEARHESEPAGWDGQGKTFQSERILVWLHSTVASRNPAVGTPPGRAWDIVDAG